MKTPKETPKRRGSAGGLTLYTATAIAALATITFSLSVLLTLEYGEALISLLSALFSQP